MGLKSLKKKKTLIRKKNPSVVELPLSPQQTNKTFIKIYVILMSEVFSVQRPNNFQPKNIAKFSSKKNKTKISSKKRSLGQNFDQDWYKIGGPIYYQYSPNHFKINGRIFFHPPKKGPFWGVCFFEIKSSIFVRLG